MNTSSETLPIAPECKYTLTTGSTDLLDCISEGQRQLTRIGVNVDSVLDHSQNVCSISLTLPKNITSHTAIVRRLFEMWKGWGVNITLDQNPHEVLSISNSPHCQPLGDNIEPDYLYHGFTTTRTDSQQAFQGVVRAYAEQQQ